MFGAKHGCSIFIGIAVLGFPAATASAREGESTALLKPLEVRYKAELPAASTNGPFALLAAFPQAVARSSRPDRPRRAQAISREDRSLLETSGAFPLSVGKAKVSSGFRMRRHPLLGGWRPHHGVDLAAPAGTPVYATADGIVGAAGSKGGYGLSIALEHGRGVETRYAHLSRLNVARGQHVRRGSLIGWVGSTGLSTGPHLHFETRISGRPVDPSRHIRRK